MQVRDRLLHGHDRHGLRELHVPREGEPPAIARPLLLTLGLPTFGLSFAISVLFLEGAADLPARDVATAAASRASRPAA